jgi:2-polyprenyl-3-methyl-5-hydroxy-6-metoxy-1,4-benzoquinol methylase
MPSDNELSQVLSRGFVGSGKDFSERIAILKSYVSTGKLLDYGCSWGYGTWQIQRAGFETVGFEIDVTRAKYGRDKLGLNIYTGWDELRNTGIKYDILFTSHVLEHLPSLKRTFLDFNTILALQGLLLIFVPNCTGIETPQIFERKKSFAFGEKHTFAFTADFFLHNLPKSGFQIEQIDVTPHGSPKPTLVNGSELLVVARKQPKSI